MIPHLLGFVKKMQNRWTLSLIEDWKSTLNWENQTSQQFQTEFGEAKLQNYFCFGAGETSTVYLGSIFTAER